MRSCGACRQAHSPLRRSATCILRDAQRRRSISLCAFRFYRPHNVHSGASGLPLLRMPRRAVAPVKLRAVRAFADCKLTRMAAHFAGGLADTPRPYAR